MLSVPKSMCAYVWIAACFYIFFFSFQIFLIHFIAIFFITPISICACDTVLYMCIYNAFFHCNFVLLSVFMYFIGYQFSKQNLIQSISTGNDALIPIGLLQFFFCVICTLVVWVCRKWKRIKFIRKKNQALSLCSLSTAIITHGDWSSTTCY